ncbi:hypothetical protein [Streptomyces pathocidini]|uniref:hypothetical protein n=1 Tax=Streptomyces pathocidini TaxID=1650571 RepID=UPI001F0B17D6|nr:hypothetical protein [Streptomyces pathocidini]
MPTTLRINEFDHREVDRATVHSGAFHVVADHQAPDTGPLALEAVLDHGLMGTEPEEGETCQ